MDTLESLETKIIHMTRSATAWLELFQVSPLKLVSLEEDQLQSGEELLQEVWALRQQLSVVHKALGFALGQLSASNAHCTAIHRELGDVRERLMNVTKVRECGSKKIKAHFDTSRDLCAEFNQEEADRQERARITAKKEKNKEAEDAESNCQIAMDAPNRDFTGQLAAYKKDDLRALAIALSISDKGTNSKLSSRILHCFEQNPDLKHNSWFIGLFKRSTCEGKGPVAHQEEDKRVGGMTELTTGPLAGPSTFLMLPYHHSLLPPIIHPGPQAGMSSASTDTSAHNYNFTTSHSYGYSL